jgi:hypothetical protein
LGNYEPFAKLLRNGGRHSGQPWGSLGTTRNPTPLAAGPKQFWIPAFAEVSEEMTFEFGFRIFVSATHEKPKALL